MKTQTKYAFTGKMRTGKDFLSKQIDGAIIGFADPLYEIARRLFPQVDLDKDKTPGLRKFYQELGQLGRGEVTDGYPLSLQRAVIIDWWRHNGDRYCSMPIDWATFGSNDRIWADCLLARVEQYLAPELYPPGINEEAVIPPSGIVCVTNVRFENERAILKDAGWDIWHVMCSRPTWEDRLRKVGVAINDPKLSDLSEQLALKLDRHVLEAIKRQRVGPKLRVIWNDNRPSPSDRLFTIDQFKSYVESRKPARPQLSGSESPTAGIAASADAATSASALAKRDEDAPARVNSDRNSSAGRRARGRCVKPTRFCCSGTLLTSCRVSCCMSPSICRCSNRSRQWWEGSASFWKRPNPSARRKANRHKVRDMTVGTKSLLFGVHQFLWHPLVVARAWRLWYGRWPKLWEWVVIIVHDWGYWGCQDMDGPHGLPHPVAGARIARGVLFLYPRRTRQEAFKLALGHSSHFSRIAKMPQSALCIPDKLSLLFEPWWFYRLRAEASGELSGYVANGPAGQTPVQWFRWLQGHFREKYGLLNSVSQNPGVRLRASMGR